LFCIFNIQERKKKLFKKNPPYRTEKVIIPKKAVFEKLTAFSYNGKTDFNAVKGHLHSYSKWLVLSENCVLPENSGLFAFRSNKLYSQMLFNSLVKIFSSSNAAFCRLSLLIIDKTGDFSSRLSELVSFAGRITVMTENSLKYNYCAEEIFDEYGAVVNVIDYNSRMPDAFVTLSLTEGSRYSMCIMIKNSLQGGKIRLTGGDFTLPFELAKYKPDEVDNYAFASALYSLCSVKELGKIAFDCLRCNSRSIMYESAVKMLDTIE